jgi:hypothetical protein
LRKSEDIFAEVLAIVEAHCVGTTTAAEALVSRADELSDLALKDPEAQTYAMTTIVITNLYAQWADKVTRASMNHEYAEALYEEMFNEHKRIDGGGD